MFKSKAFVRDLAIVMALALTLSGCDLPTPQKKSNSGESAATFTVDGVTGTLLDEKISVDFGYPTERQYSMTACVKDVAYAKPIISHEFEIADLNLKLI